MSENNTYLDNYDKEDEIELDSEKELLKRKQGGVRRSGPQVQSIQIFTCPKCGFELKDKESFEKHVKQHKNFGKSCHKCGETFKNNTDLEFHQLYEHTEQTQWNCIKCSFQGSDRDNLKNHMNFKHTKENDREVYTCEECERQFRSTWHLRNHTRDEHGSKEECSFYKENRCRFGNTCWKKHVPSTGNNSYTCYTCKQMFQSMNTLIL